MCSKIAEKQPDSCHFCNIFSVLHRKSTLHRVIIAHADRHIVAISFTVCFLFLFFLFVCTVTDFSGEDKATGVKFCTVAYRRPGQRISHFWELFFFRSPKLDKSARRARVDVGSACVDNRQFPSLAILVVKFITFIGCYLKS